MIFHFPPYVLDIDVEKTREYYEHKYAHEHYCSCAGCHNYEKAIAYAPKEIFDFFSQLGLDVRKPGEVYTLYTDDDGLVEYGGWYHLCGKVIEGEKVKEHSDIRRIPLDIHYPSLECANQGIIKEFSVSFREACSCLPDDFPLPAFQLDISAKAPWVLPEPNPDADRPRKRTIIGSIKKWFDYRKHDASIPNFEQQLLEKGFPKTIAQDVSAVFQIIPKRKKAYGLSEQFVTYRIQNDEIEIPYRVYWDEPKDEDLESLSPRQLMILHCIYSRSHDGYIRQKHIESIVSGDYPDWAIPYVVKICDEYVVEIIEVVYEHLAETDTERIKKFCAQNYATFCRSYQRMISYWDIYYRQQYPCFKDYIGRKLFIECLGAKRTMRCSKDRIPLSTGELISSIHRYMYASDYQVNRIPYHILIVLSIPLILFYISLSPWFWDLTYRNSNLGYVFLPITIGLGLLVFIVFGFVLISRIWFHIKNRPRNRVGSLAQKLTAKFDFAKTNDTPSQGVTPKTLEIIRILFDPIDVDTAVTLLVENCGNNLPFCDECDSDQLERIRFAALKISDGSMDRLDEAIDLANTDWRDLLMAADFGDDIHVHTVWADSILSI